MPVRIFPPIDESCHSVDFYHYANQADICDFNVKLLMISNHYPYLAMNGDPSLIKYELHESFQLLYRDYKFDARRPLRPSPVIYLHERLIGKLFNKIGVHVVADHSVCEVAVSRAHVLGSHATLAEIYGPIREHSSSYVNSSLMIGRVGAVESFVFSVHSFRSPIYREGITCRKSDQINPQMRVVHVGMRVWGGREAEEIDSNESSCLGFVVSEVVVMKARLRVEVLAGEAEWGIRRAGRGPCCCAPQCAACVPGEGARLVDELGRGADEVGDDGEEALVDGVVRGLCRQDAFGLSQRTEAVVVPSDGDLVGQRICIGDLLAQIGPVPDEGDLLHHGIAVGSQLLFRCTAAERVIDVAPTGAVWD